MSLKHVNEKKNGFYSVIILIIALLMISTSSKAQNVKFESYQESKYKMYNVYKGHYETFYCKAKFDRKRNITLPEGMTVPNKHKSRTMMEWEHLVPAENFGKTFKEWREAKKECGSDSYSRQCARELNPEFNRMEADMYNLYPSIGFINAMRSNYNFAELPKEIPNAVKGCHFKIRNRKVEPADYTKGAIARTYLYMEDSYPNYSISKKMKKMLLEWDKEHPVDKWECIRAKRIEKIQGNPNKFVKEPCIKKGLWEQ